MVYMVCTPYMCHSYILHPDIYMVCTPFLHPTFSHPTSCVGRCQKGVHTIYIYEHVCSTVSMILPHAEAIFAKKCVCAFMHNMSVCMCNMYMCMYICMCVFTPIYMYVCTHTHARMCVHLYVCT